MSKNSEFFLGKKEEDKIGGTYEGGNTSHREFRTGDDGSGEGISKKAEESSEAEREEKDGAVVIAKNEAHDVGNDETHETDDTAAGYGSSNKNGRNNQDAEGGALDIYTGGLCRIAT